MGVDSGPGSLAGPPGFRAGTAWILAIVPVRPKFPGDFLGGPGFDQWAAPHGRTDGVKGILRADRVPRPRGWRFR